MSSTFDRSAIMKAAHFMARWRRASVGGSYFESTPTTPAGALALLRFIADHLDDLIDDSQERVPDAIRNSLAVLNEEARA